MELQLNPRPDDRIHRTEARLSHHVRHSKINSQAIINLARADFDSVCAFSLLASLTRTGDRTDELIRHFDQFMNFDHPNLSKTRIQRLSDDLASVCTRSVRENHPSEYEDRTGPLLLLTTGRAVQYIEFGQG